MKDKLKELGSGILFIGIGIGMMVIAVWWHLSDPKEPELDEFTYETTEVEIGESTFILDISDSDEMRKQGLSGVGSLSPNTGMLFVFDSSHAWGMWMKDMLIPLDILWISEQRQIVHMVEEARPETYPNVFVPATSTSYVIEVPIGTINNNNVKVGDFVKFDL